MYSKKINELATELDLQNTDLIPVGDPDTGQLKKIPIGDLTINGGQDGVFSGGIVTWTGTGLVFNVSPCIYYINGVRYQSPYTQVTLDAADPTDPRIDVIAVNTSNVVVVVKGAADPSPIEPQVDPETQLQLTNITIDAGATTPNGVTNTVVYDENTEWTGSASGSSGYSVSFTNTVTPNTGTKCTLINAPLGSVTVFYTNATAVNTSSFQTLSFAIRLNSVWSITQGISVAFYNGNTRVSNIYSIAPTNTVGFSRGTINVYQTVQIAMGQFTFSSNSFNKIRFQFTGVARTFRLDTIILGSGINQGGGGGTSQSKSFGYVNATSGTASSTIPSDTLTVTGTGIISTSATGKTLTITTPNISSASDSVIKLDSTSKGFLMPRMTLAQRTAISSPSIGLLVYQTDTTEGVYQYTSAGWTLIGSGGGGGSSVGSDLFNFYNFI